MISEVIIGAETLNYHYDLKEVKENHRPPQIL